jgi:hypothetical protein
MEMSIVNAANSTAICGAENPCARDRDDGGFDTMGLFGLSMRGLVFTLQSSIAPERAMNMPRLRQWNAIKREFAGVKIAALPCKAPRF